MTVSVRFAGESPFGSTGSGVDLRSYWMRLNRSGWFGTRKDAIKRALGLDGLPHTHHAGEDAAEPAQVFQAVLDGAK